MIGLLSMLLQLLQLVILVDAIASWVRGPDEFPRNITGQITEPLYAPIRAVIGNIGGIDLSPLLMLMLLRFGQNLLHGGG